MSEAFTSYEVDNDKKFQKALAEAGKRVANLTTPLNLIANDFYKSERAIFQLKSAGQYPDLADRTKQFKIGLLGTPYPILRLTGKLEASLTKRGDANAVNDILGKKTLVIGTLVDYGVYHQSDKPRSVIPLRKFLFIGPEAPKFATSEQMGRLERWMSILSDYVNKAIEKGKS